MSLSEPFIRRPVGTTLLAIGLFLVGGVAYVNLPVASVPNVDFPSIRVTASRPGADPSIMASTVAAPLERRVLRSPSDGARSVGDESRPNARRRAVALELLTNERSSSRRCIARTRSRVSAKKGLNFLRPQSFDRQGP